MARQAASDNVTSSFMHTRRFVHRLIMLAPLVGLVAGLLAARPASAVVSLDVDHPDGSPALFSDGMILQRDLPAPVYGTAAVGEQVTVTLDGQQKIAVAGPDGTWGIAFDPMPAGGPFVMTVQGASNTIFVNEVRIGEVWVAAGQSNMRRQRVKRFDLEDNPSIRTLRKRDWEDRPGINPWKFALNLQAALGGIPIGILNLAVGGSRSTLWLGQSAASDPDPELQQYLKLRWGRLYSKYASPVQPYRVRGIMWWQGESDRKRTARHRTVFEPLIRSWRNEWGYGNIPWISMQIPTGRGLKLGVAPDSLPPNPSASDDNAFMRHTFLRSLEAFPLTSVISSLDLDGGIHPVDTDAYSKRMSDQALALVYGHHIPYSGPLYASMAIEGSSIRISYRDKTADGLVAQGGPLQGFAITEDLVTWHWADAQIEVDEVVVSSAQAPNPIAVRYAWANRPTWANLFNGAGLTAVPFSTDTTPGQWGGP